MKAHPSRAVAVNARLEARLGFLGELAAGPLAIGLLSGTPAVALAVAGIRRINRAFAAPAA
jgi:hypothetical protein